MSVAEPEVAFDPLEEGFVEWPYDQYGRLREHDPVHRSELLYGWVVTRFDDVNALLRDPTISSEIDKATPTPLTEPEIERRDERARGGRTLVLLDDPEHARIRKLMAKPFRSKEVEGLRGMIERRVAAAFDRLVADRGEGRVELELIEDFAYPLPVEIFCEMVGIPEEDHPRFRYWTQCVARSLDPLMSEEEREACLLGTDEMYAYLEELAAEKEAHPTDDLMSELVHAEVDGERLSHEDLMSQLLTLYVAGHEPTAGLIGNGMLALLNAPDQLERLRREPDLLRNAVSELLRYDGPNQFVRRITTRPTRLGDVEIPAGAVVYASPGSANRDPDRWDRADDVVIDRTDAGQHLQFGAGIHACLGSHLARAQAEAAFAEILRRLGGVELAGEPEWSPRMVIRGLNRLPITCTVSAS